MQPKLLSPVSLLLAMGVLGAATPTPHTENIEIAPAPAAVARAPRGVFTLQCSQGLTKGCERLGYKCDQNGRMWGTWVQACEDHCECVELDFICSNPLKC